jgi:hypothetical protein
MVSKTIKQYNTIASLIDTQLQLRLYALLTKNKDNYVIQKKMKMAVILIRGYVFALNFFRIYIPILFALR